MPIVPIKNDTPDSLYDSFINVACSEGLAQLLSADVETKTRFRDQLKGSLKGDKKLKDLLMDVFTINSANLIGDENNRQASYVIRSLVHYVMLNLLNPEYTAINPDHIVKELSTVPGTYRISLPNYSTDYIKPFLEKFSQLYDKKFAKLFKLSDRKTPGVDDRTTPVIDRKTPGIDEAPEKKVKNLAKFLVETMNPQPSNSESPIFASEVAKYVADIIGETELDKLIMEQIRFYERNMERILSSAALTSSAPQVTPEARSSAPTPVTPAAGSAAETEQSFQVIESQDVQRDKPTTQRPLSSIDEESAASGSPVTPPSRERPTSAPPSAPNTPERKNLSSKPPSALNTPDKKSTSSNESTPGKILHSPQAKKTALTERVRELPSPLASSSQGSPVARRFRMFSRELGANAPATSAEVETSSTRSIQDIPEVDAPPRSRRRMVINQQKEDDNKKDTPEGGKLTPK